MMDPLDTSPNVQLTTIAFSGEEIRFGFDNTYARLPGHFYARLDPTPVAAPRLVKVKVEFLLNGERTRLVESYPFNRDRAVDLPGTLGEYGSFQRNAFLSELVVGWQQGVPSVRFTSLTGKRKDFCMCNSGPVTRWHCRGFRQAPISRFGQLTGRSVRVSPPNKSTFSSTAMGIYVAVAQFAKVSC
jgi:hypothetical protein